MSDIPQCAILIPSLGRSENTEPLISNIRANTSSDHQIYFMTQDEETRKIAESMGTVVFTDPTSRTDYVARTNALYRLTDEPIIFTGSNDMLTTPGWLDKMWQKMCEGYSVVVPQDGLNPNGTQALISREYIQTQSCCMDEPNTVYFSGYKHAFSETEQFEVAQKRGVFARSDALVEHLHHINKKREYDDTYRQAEKNSAGGDNIFYSRRHLWS